MKATEPAPSPGGFPAELCALPQWLCWKTAKRKGKITKVPVSPHGGAGKPNVSNTWGTLGEALAHAERCGLAGVGFVFSEDDPYCGVDLDGCRDPETGELAPWAAELVAALGSYSEASPSDTGVHVIVRGSVPAGGNRKGAVEMYDRGRFFTMTGEALDGSPAEIGDRQGELEALHRRLFPPQPAKGPGTAPAARNGRPAADPPELPDDALLERARNAKNGERFARLYAGDRSGYDSDSEADLALCSMLAFWPTDEPQLDRLFRQSGLYREKWERADYRERTIRKAIEDRTERWGGPGAAVVPLRPHAAERNGSGPEDGGGAPPLEAGYNLTDLGNAERFVDAHGDDLLWVEPWKRWMVWDGARWEHDRTREAWRRAEDTVRSIYTEASRVGDSERRKAIANHAKKCESATRIREMLELAKAKTWAIPEEFDGDNYLLNVQNGTLDLRAGELREHRREDRITKRAPVAYDPDAEAPTFAAFMERIMPSPEVRQFLQRAAGYSATGDISEQCLFINWGAGANGKSTFQETISAALGDYAMQGPAELLLAKPAGTDGIPNDVARLKGARFVSASEVEEGRRFAEARVKQLTGGDTISARFLHAEFFDFEPTHKLWVSTNPKPNVSRGGYAFWRRIRLIPFTETIPPDEQDPQLPEKLKDELPGVLAWIVRGAVAWRAGGLRAPEEVKAATEEYREETDTLAAFISERCVEGTNLSIQAKQLYEPYKNWCEENGEKYETMKGFSQRLVERGFEKQKDGSGRVRYYGLALRPEDDDPGGLLTPPPEPPKDDAPPFGDEDAPPSPSGRASGLTPTPPAKSESAPAPRKGAVEASEEPGTVSDGLSEAFRGAPGRSGEPSGAAPHTLGENATETPAEVDRPKNASDARETDKEGGDVGVRVREELRKPWAVRQLGLIRGGRDNLINPTANTVACRLFGSPHRWREMLTFVEQAVAEEGGNKA